jgi:hypothetical protein
MYDHHSGDYNWGTEALNRFLCSVVNLWASFPTSQHVLLQPLFGVFAEKFVDQTSVYQDAPHVTLRLSRTGGFIPLSINTRAIHNSAVVLLPSKPVKPVLQSPYTFHAATC